MTLLFIWSQVEKTMAIGIQGQSILVQRPKFFIVTLYLCWQRDAVVYYSGEAETAWHGTTSVKH